MYCNRKLYRLFHSNNGLSDSSYINVEVILDWTGSMGEVRKVRAVNENLKEVWVLSGVFGLRYLEAGNLLDDANLEGLPAFEHLAAYDLLLAHLAVDTVVHHCDLLNQIALNNISYDFATAIMGRKVECAPFHSRAINVVKLQ